MVYGRYNEPVHGDTIMVYKPTNITEGPHPVPSGNLSVCYWTWPFIVRWFTLKTVIFHSYVNLPEANDWIGDVSINLLVG